MIVVPTDHSFIIASSARLVGEDNHRLQAWAERHVRTDPDLRWIVGNYVEADQANSNGHIFPLQELLVAQETLAGKPLNMMHREHYIVGFFAGAQLLSPQGVELRSGEEIPQAALAETAERPYVEALAGMWHSRFPEEFFNIRRAHAEGSLFFSMESIPEAVSCPTCEHHSPYQGLESASYCTHMQGATGPKVLHRPVFNGGAIIIPPVKPGWHRADIKAISKWLETEALAPSVYAQAEAEAPDLDAVHWEALMGEVMSVARDFSQDRRRDLAKKGNAMPDGSFPIENRADLRNAIRLAGRSKNPSAAKRHIKRMAKKLGLTDMIPDEW